MSFTPADLPPSAQSVLDQVITRLQQDPSANPFLIVHDVIFTRFYPPVPNHVFVQLYVVSGILGLALLINLLTYIIRLKRSSSWSLFRTYGTSRGRFLLPQTSNTWCCLTAIFLIVVQPAIYKNIDIYRDHKTQISFVLWKLLTFLPLWLTVLCEAWGMAATLLLTNGSKPEQKGAAFRPRCSPVLINSAFLLIATLVPAAVITLFVFANVRYNDAFRLFEAVQDRLKEQADSYNGVFDTTVVEALLPIGTIFLKAMKDFVPYFRVGTIIYVGSAAILLLFYVVVCLLHIRTLKAQIDQSKAQGEINGPLPPEGTGSNLSEKMQHTQSMIPQYYNLIASALTILICGILYMTVAVIALLEVEQKVSSPAFIMAQVLAPYWIYAVLGTAVHILLFTRALQLHSGPSHIRAHETTDQMLMPHTLSDILNAQQSRFPLGEAENSNKSFSGYIRSTKPSTATAPSLDDLAKSLVANSPPKESIFGQTIGPLPTTITISPLAAIRERRQDFGWLSLENRDKDDDPKFMDHPFSQLQ
ncbi:hypothetical protein BT69DRAFT_1330086 [Atractiella rhizophila]|nr:hypothetical protein BT69DRAFT_1330086 [Atractiella rhizophila]